MSTQRKQYSAEFKARVAFEALQGLKTVNELARTYGVHPTQIAPLEASPPKGEARDFLGMPVKSGSMSRRHSKASSTSKLDNSKWRWTG